MRFCVKLIPRLQPCAERVLVCPPHIDVFRFRDRLRQLLFYFCLCLAEDVLNQPLAGLFVISGRVPSFPAPILALSDVAFTVCSLLCHVYASFSSVAQTTTREPAQSLLIFSRDRNIFQLVPYVSEIPILCLLRRSFYAGQIPSSSLTSFLSAL